MKMKRRQGLEVMRNWKLGQGPEAGWTRTLISRERQAGHERRKMKKRGICGRLNKKTSVIGN